MKWFKTTETPTPLDTPVLTTRSNWHGMQIALCLVDRVSKKVHWYECEGANGWSEEEDWQGLGMEEIPTPQYWAYLPNPPCKEETDED